MDCTTCRWVGYKNYGKENYSCHQYIMSIEEEKRIARNNGESTMKINETYDFFCVNCGEITRQTYRGIYADGNHLYICKECGCENTEAKGD